ncbi:putative VP1 [Microviridae sp.]|nr:putative VP1 [Microviridae sp.]
MNRNTESHFATNPTSIDVQRSVFDRSSSVKTTFNVGELVPFYIDEVLPGDTFSVDRSIVARLQTLITPPMDNLYLDTYFFYVPNRLVWEHWKQFCGENTESPWIPQTEYEIPQITSPTGGWSTGTLADYFGIPTGVENLSVSALPFRAYALIVNDWFRDENLCDPLAFPITDATVTGVNTGNFVSDCAKGGKPYIAAKYHDYFTSCLPSPQKGPDVMIPGGTGANVPVYALGQEVPSLSDTAGLVTRTSYGGKDYSSIPFSGGSGSVGIFSSSGKTSTFSDALAASTVYPVNLWAVGNSSLATATINQLRLAFQIQKFYEKAARGGTRYIEVIKSFFGVTSPDARLQRPEYLGGNRIPIHIQQVVQNSGTQDSGTPQGTPTGLSVTSDTHSDFTKSFVEHGFVIGLMVARYDHTYQQGIERFWSRKSKFDYYWPVFANIGEQAVKNKEIYAQGNAKDDEVFGYQEAWADYRYKPNRVSGEMRSTATAPLDSWHFADKYTQLPTLSDEWIREDKSNVDRALAVTSAVSNQIFCDIFIQNRSTRPMPLYSVPGLIDHH